MGRKQKHSAKLARRNSEAAPIGVVGLGLMGKSVVACLLSAGHAVVGLDADPIRRRQAKIRVLTLLKEMRAEGLLQEPPQQAVRRLQVSENYPSFASCPVVIEAITEDLGAKRRALRKIEQAVPSRTLIASNTSAIPISDLQRSAAHPERILGMHWAEPAHVTRFMEVICGKRTSSGCARRALRWARSWRKEPSLVRKDVRGFITNRISYAMFREACHLVETGVATFADVDRSLRNDLGYWITFAGPFRYMDLMGILPYQKVMADLLPDLDCSQKVPQVMRKVVDSGARGISNCRGFYRYTPAQAKRWEKLFLKFNYEVRKLAMKYPEDVGDRPLRRGGARWTAPRLPKRSRG
jgi:3-hydroxyacyl-CoA dehydrogenase